MSKYKLVPVKPTREMIDAGCKKHTCNYGDFCLESEIEDQDVKSIYAAMLAAAPEAEKPKLSVSGYTEDEILMCQHILLELAAADLDSLDTGVIELYGEDDQGREGCTEVNFQEYAAKSAAILGQVTAASEVEQEPYAYEYGVSNGDGTFSVVINKGKFTQLGENEYGYCHPGISASKEWPVTPLYLHPQPAPEAGECRKFTFWAVYDATSAQKYIKMDIDTGCLAIFDIEGRAASFAADCPGADYKELVLYSCPQPAPDVQGEPIPAGFALIKLDSRTGKPLVTSEMKAKHIGEYWWDEEAPYYDEHGDLHDYVARHAVPWSLCKEIYKNMASTAILSAQPAEQSECGCCGQTVRCDDDCDAVVIGGHRATEQKPLKSSLALDAATHLTNWLDMDWCECEGGHTCGYNEVLRTRDALRAVAEQQPAPDTALVEAFDAGRRAAHEEAAGLVEALERCMSSMLDAGFNARSAVIAQGWQALAAYRQQGGEA